jgi:hypothetical protein
MSLLEQCRNDLEIARAERQQALENLHEAREIVSSSRAEYWQSKESHDVQVSHRDTANAELRETRKEIANLEKSLARARLRLAQQEEDAKRVIRPEAVRSGKYLEEVISRNRWAERQLVDSKRAAYLATEKLKSVELAYRNAGGKLSREEMLVERNPWKSGSFYLVGFVLILCVVGFIAIKLPWYLVGMVIIGSVLAISIVGALQLRHDDLLSEENFLQLMIETFKALPLLNKMASKSQANASTQVEDSESNQGK